MRTGDGARTGSRSRRVLRGLATGVLALGVVGLLIWGLMFFRVFVLLPQQARTEAQTGLDAAVLDLPALAEADGEALDAAFGPVVGTERSVQCSVYPVDRGWFVADHVHRCELRDVEYRVAPGAREQVAERGAEALADVPAWSEARDPRGIERESCTVVAESTAAASDEIPVGSPTVRL
ncbi:MAG: hypothetical protein Q4G40_08150, partial [Brachybacterium sp.]|nr:hypothetical protein [Brachybacterium sp.]